MQHTALPFSGTTCRAGDGGYLFGCEFLAFHSRRIRQHPIAKPLNIERDPYLPLTALGQDIFPCYAKVSSIVQDDTQERIVDVDLAVVLDKTELPEFVHE